MRTLGILLFFTLITGPLFAAEKIKDGFYSDYDAKGVLVKTTQYHYGVPNGRFRTFYPDGRLEGWGSYLNGKMEGMAVAYYPSGVLKLKSFYQEGKLHGKATLYWANGKIKSESEYIKGVQDGLEREYDEFGNPIIARHFKWGKEHGFTKEFFHGSGHVMRETQYQQGRQLGVVKEYYPNGFVKGLYEARDGVKEGLAYEYDDLGRKLREGSMVNNQWHGVVIHYHPTGEALSKVNYTNGVLNDPQWKEYYTNGNLMHEVKVVNGKKQGLARSFYKDGRLNSEGNFVDDRQEGLFKLYAPEGYLQYEDIFRMGKLYKRREYDAKGQPVMEQQFYQ